MGGLTSTTLVKPRLGFVGVGWIGLNRLKSVLQEDCAEAACIADPNGAALREARSLVPQAVVCDDLDALLQTDVDGVVLATPSGLHADQAIRALDAGKAVFCQKPLGRTAAEVEAVLAAARRNDRLLGVDLSYRYVEAMRVTRETVQAGEVGRVFAVDLIFHNAYGPDKGWAGQFDLAGGGSLIDLGIHLVDLLLWTLGWPRVIGVESALFREGVRLPLPTREIEDYAHANIEIDGGVSARLACSWHFNCGCDALIHISFHGTDGSATFQNVDGSFFDFAAEKRRGAGAETLAAPPDEWGGRALTFWAGRLSEDPSYDASIDDAADVANVLDLLYGRVEGEADR